MTREAENVAGRVARVLETIDKLMQQQTLLGGSDVVPDADPLDRVIPPDRRVQQRLRWKHCVRDVVEADNGSSERSAKTVADFDVNSVFVSDVTHYSIRSCDYGANWATRSPGPTRRQSTERTLRGCLPHHKVRLVNIGRNHYGSNQLVI
jgi:hypothetical protein